MFVCSGAGAAQPPSEGVLRGTRKNKAIGAVFWYGTCASGPREHACGSRQLRKFSTCPQIVHGNGGRSPIISWRCAVRRFFSLQTSLLGILRIIHITCKPARHGRPPQASLRSGTPLEGLSEGPPEGGGGRQTRQTASAPSADLRRPSGGSSIFTVYGKRSTRRSAKCHK